MFHFYNPLKRQNPFGDGRAGRGGGGVKKQNIGLEQVKRFPLFKSR